MTIKSLRQYFAPDVAASTTATTSYQNDLSVYATAAELPLTGNKKGQQAFVSATNRLYVWNGNGWYNIATIASDLQLTQGADATYTLAKDGTATAINLSATSSNSVTWSYEVVEGSLTNGGGTTATVENVDGAFTITPTTTKDYQGEFVIRIIANDSTGYIGEEVRVVLEWVWYGDRGIFSYGSTRNDKLKYIDITVFGDASTFGTLAKSRSDHTACSNSSRGIFAGYVYETSIEYITIATLGNGTTYTSLSAGTRQAAEACSNDTYGLIAGGYGNGPTYYSIIDYTNISTLGARAQFGSLSVARSNHAAASSGVYAVWAGGGNQTYGNIIDYVTIATTGDATSFGTMATSRYRQAGCSNKTRGVFAGGYSHISNIDYITFATLGNSATFGSLTTGRDNAMACSNGSRGIFASGRFAESSIEYITIDTLGNASNFGLCPFDTAWGTEGAACSGN